MITSVRECEMKLNIHSDIWHLEIDKEYHPTLHSACDYIPVLVLKFIHVDKSVPDRELQYLRVMLGKCMRNAWAHDVAHQFD